MNVLPVLKQYACVLCGRGWRGRSLARYCATKCIEEFGVVAS